MANDHSSPVSIPEVLVGHAEVRRGSQVKLLGEPHKRFKNFVGALSLGLLKTRTTVASRTVGAFDGH